MSGMLGAFLLRNCEVNLSNSCKNQESIPLHTAPQTPLLPRTSSRAPTAWSWSSWCPRAVRTRGGSWGWVCWSAPRGGFWGIWRSFPGIATGGFIVCVCECGGGVGPTFLGGGCMVSKYSFTPLTAPLPTLPTRRLLIMPPTDRQSWRRRGSNTVRGRRRPDGMIEMRRSLAFNEQLLLITLIREIEWRLTLVLWQIWRFRGFFYDMAPYRRRLLKLAD